MKKRALAAVAVSIALLVPTSAEAVSVSSAHGIGSQSRAKSYENGAKTKGDLRSKKGDPVYYEGKYLYSNKPMCSNGKVGRYTGDIKSKKKHEASGLIASAPSPYCKNAKVQSRVSKNIKLRPDPSGKWSKKY